MPPQCAVGTVPLMTPTQLRAFFAVASTGSFTAAARLLHTSQPPITTHVRELEARYGVELFHRHGRGVELTPVGRQLLAIAQRVVTNQQEAVELLRDAGKLEHGHLRIGAVTPLGITEALSRFHARHPQVKITVSPGNSSELLEGLRRYRFDVAFVGQMGAMDEFDVACHTQHEIVLLVGPSHPWAARESIELHELEGEPLIFREEGSNTQRALQEVAQHAGVKLAQALTYGSREGLIACVAAGLGVGPILADQFVDHPELRALTIKGLNLTVDGYLACLKERRDSRIVRAFVELAGQNQNAFGSQAHTT